MSSKEDVIEFSGKNVLFIAPNFFGCDEAIKAELERRGARVERLLDRPFQSALFKAVALLGGQVVCRFLEPYYRFKLNQLKINVDLILIVNGQTLSSKTLQRISSKWPNAKKILYMWDSAENRPTIVKNLNWFDKKFSFDPASCDKYGFQFRPLFFYGKPQLIAGLKYKISFVGTCHSDRYKVVSRVLDCFPNCETYVYLYLQARWLFLYRSLTSKHYKGSSVSDFFYVGLSPYIAAAVFDESEIVLDIEHPKQSGLTIRTFDVIRSGKKLITTNKNILNYDFYRTGNILIVDRNKPFIPDEFINKNVVDYGDDIRYRYSIQGWVNEIFTRV